MLIDQSYFVGILKVPNVDADYVLERLQTFIETKEPQLLQDLLGYSLYTALADALQTQEEASGSPSSLPTRFDKLVNGTVYTGQDGKTRRWNGLVFVKNDTPVSLIANYIFWHWLNDQQKQVTGLGVQATQAQNANLVSAMSNLATVWNQMSRMINELYYYMMSTYRTDYTEWTTIDGMRMLAFFKPSNQFGI